MPPITKAKLENASLDANSLETFINGADNQVVNTRLGRNVPSIAKTIKDAQDLSAQKFDEAHVAIYAARDQSQAAASNSTAQAGIAQIAAQSALTSNWSYFVQNVSDLASISATTGQRALVRLPTPHTYTFNGTDWGVGVPSVLNDYATKREVDVVQVTDDEDLLFVFEDRRGNRAPFALRKSDGSLNDGTIFDIFKRLLSLAPLPTYEEIDDLMFAQVDRKGNIAWGCVREKDGQWPEWAIGQLSERLVNGDYLVSNNVNDWPDIFSSEVATRIAQYLPISSPSQWGDDETQAAAVKLQPYFGAGEGSVDWLNGKGFVGKYSDNNAIPSYYYRSGKTREVDAAMNEIVSLGSSTFNNLSSSFSSMFAALQTHKDELITFSNMAKGGERLAHCQARTGIKPAMLTLPGNTAPASGSIDVAVNDPWLSITTSFLATNGYIGDNPAEFTLSVVGSSYRLTRVGTGVAFVVAPNTPFFPKTGPDNLRKFALINIGKNDITTGSTTADEIVLRTRNIVQSLFPLHKRFMIVNHFNNTGLAASHATRTKSVAVNAALKTEYGPNLININEDFLQHPNFWDWMLEANPLFEGPTSTDLSEQSLGNLAPSQGADSGHMNAVTNQLFVNKMVRPFLKDMYGYKDL